MNAVAAAAGTAALSPYEINPDQHFSVLDELEELIDARAGEEDADGDDRGGYTPNEAMRTNEVLRQVHARVAALIGAVQFVRFTAAGPAGYTEGAHRHLSRALRNVDPKALQLQAPTFQGASHG